MKVPLDTRSRPLRNLGISVTDRCNFRCTYCMPKEIFGRDFAFLPHGELLTFEEITRVARPFAREGVSKIRLTGGEPLLRRELERLVEMLAGIEEVKEIALTTNGSALAAKAKALKDAGPGRNRRRRGGRAQTCQGQHGRPTRRQRPHDPRDGLVLPRQRPHPPRLDRIAEAIVDAGLSDVEAGLPSWIGDVSASLPGPYRRADAQAPSQ
jgi:hypothetical protein